MPDIAESLRRKIEDQTALVGVIGLGYVGLPLSLAFVERGFRVLGFDIDPAKIERLKARQSYIAHIDSGRIDAAVESGQLDATADFDRLGEPDVVLICVPTPLTRHREPDMSYVASTARAVAQRLRRGQLVVLESTTYPGTTDELLEPVLETSGLGCGTDFFLAFSPEREDPGNIVYSTTSIPKVVGGVEPLSGDLAQALYRRLVEDTVRVSSARAAEATKLVENVFRAVNIALVNELKTIYARMGIDIWEVLDAAETKPFGFMRFDPGPGWGGHCVSGEEFVFVKRGGGIQAIRIRELAVGVVRKIGDVAVLPLDGVEVLSFDLEKQTTCFRRATHLFRRRFSKRVTLRTPEGRTLTATEGHPVIVVGDRRLDVRRADCLEGGRPIVAMALPPSETPHSIDLVHSLGLERRRGVRVAPRWSTWADHWSSIRTISRRGGIERKDLLRSNTLPLRVVLELERAGAAPYPREDLLLATGTGAGHTRVPWIIRVDTDFARLIGYYLSEGCLTFDQSWRTRWTFGAHEKELIEDLTGILDRLGFRWSIHRVKRWRAIQVKVSSNLLGFLIKETLQCGTRSETMQVPAVLMGASEEIRLQLVGALLNGDGSVDASSGVRSYRKNGKTYRHRFNSACVSYFTSSPRLFQEVLLLLHSLGFAPTIRSNGRELRLFGADQLGRLRPFLLGKKGARLDGYLSGRSKRMPNRAMHLHSGFASTATPELRRTGQGWVYSLEVPGTETYVTSYGLVSHNCIPVDPYYLTWKAREYGKTARFIELAGEINMAMPEYVVDRVTEALNAAGEAVRGSRILILGLSYKPNVGDDRESPSYHLMDLLEARGAVVAYHDPYIPRIGPTREHQRWEGTASVPWDEATIRSYDVVVISANHASIDYRQLADWARCIVDTRNAMAGIPVDPEKVWKA